MFKSISARPESLTFLAFLASLLSLSICNFPLSVLGLLQVQTRKYKGGLYMLSSRRDIPASTEVAIK